MRSFEQRGALSDLPVVLICRTSSACDVGQITGRFPRVLCPQEGRFAIVTNVGCGMRWTPCRAGRARSGRTVKSCGPDLSTLRSSWRRCFGIARTTVTRSPIAGESTKQAVKTNRAGNAGMFGEPVVTDLRASIFLHAELRVSSTTRHSLRPLFSGGDEFRDGPGAFASREGRPASLRGVKRRSNPESNLRTGSLRYRSR